MATNERSLAVQKYTDKDLISFMKNYLKENDQLPPHLVIANHFDVAPNGVNQRLSRLEREGVFQRNDVNKLKFARKS